ncbi:YycH family regulatory protein [Bacillus weihaiensis]|uniref:Regulatory protein YycH domain-containing protein n=1 Tax=Bacillus weihaiensis TaxID=1547283 RepID=A0A1L3MWT7_9BACI|nr:two-component system activity regulator YycH [Bacillus weihaiensis]APH06797.1 hypothetical protein A9C19_20140 [Bacillus weihaiensis]
MRKETMKSILLVLLVGTSLFFTWNIWGLQPYHEELENNTFFENIPISDEKRKFNEVIKPYQMFIHSNDEHFSSFQNKLLGDLWKEMQRWEFTGSNQEISRTFTNDSFLNWVDGSEDHQAKIEMRFFTGLPIDTLQTMLEWDEELDQDLQIDRIYLNVPKENETQKVYFFSTEEMTMVEASVNLTSANRYVNQVFTRRDELVSHFTFNVEGGNEFILPTEETELNSYQYVTNEIEYERFKNALFTNSRIVKQDINLSRNRFTDGTRELNIYPNQHLVEYVNPIPTNTNSVPASYLIDQSVGYLNDHGGWTDDYVLFDVDEYNQEVEFIMSVQSIPVIYSTENPFGPTVISQKWGQNEIAIYDRPLYQLTTNISTQTSTIMSGKKVEEILTSNPTINLEEMKNIFVGYELSGPVDQKYVQLSPAWYIELKDGNLLKLNESETEMRGDESGVE